MFTCGQILNVSRSFSRISRRLPASVCLAVLLIPYAYAHAPVLADNETSIQNDIPSLYQTFAGYFPVGAAIWQGDIAGVHSELLKKHFNSITAENAMKWAVIQPIEGRFNFAPAHALVHFAKANHMRVRGHTLRCPKQL